MKSFVAYISILVFVIYWSITILFTFPDNPINVKFLKFRQYFDRYCYQNWSFFAPPATFNERIYFSYSYKDSSTNTVKIKTFEMLDTIKKEKNKVSFLSKSQDILEYIVSGSISDIQNSLKQIYDAIKIDDLKNKKTSTDIEKTKRVIKIIEQSDSFKNLQNYGNVIAKNNAIPIENTKYKITITNIHIPKYLNKDSLNIKKKEDVIFSSNLYYLKAGK